MQTVVITLPRITRLFTVEGILILRLKLSIVSIILSLLITGTLIVVVLVPTEKTADIGVES